MSLERKKSQKAKKAKGTKKTTRSVRRVKKARKRKRPDARKAFRKKQHQGERRMASMAMGITVAEVAMFDNDEEKVYDKDLALSRKKSRNLEGKGVSKKTKAGEKHVSFLDHELLDKPKPSTQATSRVRESSQHWKSIPFSSAFKLAEDITDADDTGLDPELVDWGDEPCAEVPAGRTPSWHLALGDFLRKRADESMGGPAKRSLSRNGNGVSKKLKAVVALRKARDALNQQIPPEIVAYDASMHYHLRAQAGKLLGLSEKTQASKSATTDEKNLVHNLVTSFLDTYYDYMNMRRGVIKALVAASIQMQSISYNTALVADQNGIPRRMRPQPGYRPLVRWMHAEVYDTEKAENTALRPPGVRGAGRRLRVAIKGKQTREDKGATRKNASGNAKTKNKK